MSFAQSSSQTLYSHGKTACCREKLLLGGFFLCKLTCFPSFFHWKYWFSIWFFLLIFLDVFLWFYWKDSWVFLLNIFSMFSILPLWFFYWFFHHFENIDCIQYTMLRVRCAVWFLKRGYRHSCGLLIVFFRFDLHQRWPQLRVQGARVLVV